MIDAYGIHIGSLLYIRFYGIILVAGAAAAAYLAGSMLKRDGKDPDVVWDALLWALIFGIIGARLYHVFTPSKTLLDMGIDTRYYLTHPLDILLTWRGGLGMPGAILGGVFGLYLFARRRRLDLAQLLDYAAPGVPLAQAIGRWGNFVNQELYGPPSNLPWAIPIRPENRMAGFESFERFHPLFLYESIWNLALAGVLYWLWRNHRDRFRPPDLFLLYLVGYAVGRFLLEFLRLDYVPAFGLNLNQALMLVLALVCSAIVIIRRRKAQPA
ncbi:MAG: prolipoprotein diacylglyceryl transferase [Gammaproteobacteria bacterium RBG_16_66_13]|jgi:phosphatidylglycerol:prolipoprotein diacylglycerol transferase|nr:MAG: prolipoprotein diacylglyceryl transferase [Gammaproteobacteria bacterium RBG_16_66_13]